MKKKIYEAPVMELHHISATSMYAASPGAGNSAYPDEKQPIGGAMGKERLFDDSTLGDLW